MNYRSPDQIKRELHLGEINYLDAIEAIQEFFGFSSLAAEEMVGEWIEGTAVASQGGNSP